MNKEVLPIDVFSPRDIGVLLNHLDALAKRGGSLSRRIDPNKHDVNEALDYVLKTTPSDIQDLSFESMGRDFNQHSTSAEFLRYYIMDWLEFGYLMAIGKIDGVPAISEHELTMLFQNEHDRMVNNLFDDISLSARGYTREILIILTKLKSVPSYQPKSY